MYLVSLYFDDKTSKEINRYMGLIARKSGNVFMEDNNVPPHITVASIETLEEKLLIEKINTLKKGISPGSVDFVSVGQLLPSVIYLVPVLNKYLFDIEEEIFNSLRDINDIRFSKYYKPYSWLPHVTVGKNLDKEQMKKAFEVMLNNFVPFNGQVVEIGLAKTNPYTDIIKIKLG